MYYFSYFTQNNYMLHCDVGNLVLCDIYKQMHMHFYLMLTSSCMADIRNYLVKGKSVL